MDRSDDIAIWELAREEGYAMSRWMRIFMNTAYFAVAHRWLYGWSVATKPKRLCSSGYAQAFILKRLLDRRDEIESAALDSNIWCIEIY